MFVVNKCPGHIFNLVTLAAIVKSKMAAFEPLFLYIFNKNQHWMFLLNR